MKPATKCDVLNEGFIYATVVLSRFGRQTRHQDMTDLVGVESCDTITKELLYEAVG